MVKSDDIKKKNEEINSAGKDKDFTNKEEEKLKELEYLLQCASAECGW